MKKRIYYLIFMCWVLPGLSSCSDNDDGMDAASSFRIYGQQYMLTSGVIWQSNRNVIISTAPYTYSDTYTTPDGQTVTDVVKGFTVGTDRQETGNFTLSLYEAGLVFDKTLGKVTGEGACASFHLCSPELEKLNPGKYVYNTDKIANTFTAYTSVKYNTQQSVDPAEIAEGEIIVEKTGTDYHIVFRGKTNKDTPVNCEYDGALIDVRVPQQASAAYDNISLAGLLDSVTTISESPWFGTSSYTTLDYRNGAAFFCTATGSTRYAEGDNKSLADIALVWDKTTESFVFESPIRMRSLLGHTDEYNFPCHTVFMKAPDSFTESDFEKLDETGFDIEIREEKVIFGTHDFKPGFVFFQAGNGTIGVMHVRDYTPMGTKISSDFFGTNTSPLNPALIMDIKCPANFIDPKIR